MADTISLTIDGTKISVPKGTNIVDAAREAGIAIPVFCYHPRMKPVGMCRMCLVQVGTPRVNRETKEVDRDDDGEPIIAMMPKLQTGCTTPVSEGMVVNTTIDEVQFAQRGVLEFLLTSHPLDCPVCDKGGECPLQNLTMEWGPSNSRFDYSDKVHFEKPIPLGDLIYLDRERCILCGRCVRFQDEIADDSVLGFDNRGRNWKIISMSDPPFDSKFSGNTTDICPVGALTSSDFRFKARVWEVQSKPVVCTHCPVGCNMSMDMRYNELMRVMPRENAAVNDIWICDKGRFGQRFVQSEERLTTPLIRRGGSLQPATWDEALQLVAEKFIGVLSNVGGKALGGLADSRLSNEDLYAFQRFFRETLGSNNLDYRVGTPGEAEPDEVGAMLGVGQGTNLMELGKGATMLVLGADPEEEAPLYVLRLRAIVERGGKLILANARPTKLDRSATSKVRYKVGGEMQFVQALLRVVLDEVGTENLSNSVAGTDALRDALAQVSVADAAQAVGMEEDALRELAKSFLEAEHGIIMYGADALAVGSALTFSLGTLALLTNKAGKANSGLIGLLPGGNARGAIDMGVTATLAPGYAPLSQPGLGARDMWDAATAGKLRGMYILASDPATTNPASVAALDALEFLVVQDMFLTATAQRADVVLPASSFAEREGTFTNAERRVQRSRQAATPVGQSRPDWEIIQSIAQSIGEMSVSQRDADAVPASAARSGSVRRVTMKQESPSRSRAVYVSTTPQNTVGSANRSGVGTQTADSDWNYFTANDVASEIAERVPGYNGVTYGKLASTGKPGAWGRQVNEAVYYDGTNYGNTEGIGIQLPAYVEDTRARLDVSPLDIEEAQPSDQYPFALLTQPMLYNGGALLNNSKLLSHIPSVYAAISTADAERLGVAAGDHVQLTSSAGALELPVRVVVDLAEGSVLVPSNLVAAPLASLQTGGRTFVSMQKA